jgi:phosphatidylserine/phosphatidylglycerophosphate/cardiolipin synthase-like enzyme
MREPTLVAALQSLFEADWDIAGGAPESRMAKAPWPTFPIEVEGQQVTLGVSPKGYLPTPEAWDLPMIVKWLDEARTSIKLQVLTYKTKSRDGSEFDTFDAALRRAAARGVKVHLLVSSWNQGEASLMDLAQVPNVQVGVITIPPWSKGEVPFGRVVHAKFLAVDGTRAWVGTSNWEGDYFLKSRNVGLFVEGGAFAARVDQLFDRDAASSYVGPLKKGGWKKR